jgi:uncharacterized protein (DUF1778 family)
MPTINSTRSEQVSLRVPRATKDLLQQAAAIAGQSLTDFMVATTAEKARQLVEQHRVITLSQSAYDEFTAALNDPEIRPVSPFADKLIDDYAVAVRADGSLDW